MCESAGMRLYLLRCTCSRTADGKVSWSCRTRWHPAASGTPQTWCSWTRPVCSLGCRRPDRKCRRSCPCWETLPLQRCPVETRYGKNNQLLYSGIYAMRWSSKSVTFFFLKGYLVPHVVFEGVFRSDAVYLFNRIRGHIQAWRLAVIDHQQLVILLVGCKTLRFFKWNGK